FVVVEQGAHDGQLARDIAAALAEISPACFERLDYRVVEPRPKARDWLRQSLAGSDRIRVVSSLAETAAPEGVFLCNELLDAFPVRCLVREAGEWRERQVGLDEAGQLAWTSRPLPAALAGYA